MTKYQSNFKDEKEMKNGKMKSYKIKILYSKEEKNVVKIVELISPKSKQIQ